MAKHNGLDNIITILGALGDQSRRVFLQAFEAPNPGAKKVVAQDTTDHNSRNTVPMFTIDQIIQNLDISYNNVGFIHLDLEGWELPALVGSPGLLNHYHSDLMLEVNPTDESILSRTGDRIDEAVALLRRYGYHLLDYLPQKGENANAYFTKRSDQPTLSSFDIYLRSFEYLKIIRILRSHQLKSARAACLPPYTKLSDSE